MESRIEGTHMDMDSVYDDGYIRYLEWQID